MKPICFYHKADLDGVCSAAIVKHFVPDCELYGIDYGDEFPWALVAPTFIGNTMSFADIAAGKDVTGELRWPCGATGPRTVFMVDFSLPPADMKRLTEVSTLVWIDHHTTAIAAAIDGGYSTTKGGCAGAQTPACAACELCWRYFSIMNGPELTADNFCEQLFDATVPEAVRLLSVYDSWRASDPEWDTKVMPFQYGMRGWLWAYLPDDPRWQHVLSGLAVDPDLSCMWSFERTLYDGEAILRYQAEVNRKACEAGMRELCVHTWSPTGGYFAVPSSTREEDEKFKSDNPQSTYCRVLACNTIVFNSQFFDGFYDPEKHDVMCAYAQVLVRSDVFRGDLGAKLMWKVSLYTTKDDIDCGAICKTFGGGGHRKAAGFMCDELPWETR